MAVSYKFNVLYKISLSLGVKSDDTNANGIKTINVPTSDIVSLAIIHNYDTAMFPIVRFRLYSDLSLITELTKAPDKIRVNASLYGNVYMMPDEDNKSPILVCGAKNIEFALKGYIEEKNIPTSNMDQYDAGLKKTDNLNESIKVPIELYCFDDEMIHFMKRKAPAVFKDMSIYSVIEALFRQQGYVKYSIDPLDNQNKYDQILIPNLSITEALSFLEARYGLYEKGASVYGDFDGLNIVNSSNTESSYSSLIPIYVESYKSNDDLGGLRKNTSELAQYVSKPSYFGMNVKAENVSVVSETDIEKILNSEIVTSVNLTSLDTNFVLMRQLYDDYDIGAAITGRTTRHDAITTPDILYKSKNKYLPDMYTARISERITRIDVSCVGFDIGRIDIRSAFNILFDSPIRGMSMNKSYRPMNAVHVLTNLDANHFIAQTTMSICSND